MATDQLKKSQTGRTQGSGGPDLARGCMLDSPALATEPARLRWRAEGHATGSVISPSSPMQFVYNIHSMRRLPCCLLLQSRQQEKREFSYLVFKDTIFIYKKRIRYVYKKLILTMFDIFQKTRT